MEMIYDSLFIRFLVVENDTVAGENSNLQRDWNLFTRTLICCMRPNQGRVDKVRDKRPVLGLSGWLSGQKLLLSNSDDTWVSASPAKEDSTELSARPLHVCHCMHALTPHTAYTHTGLKKKSCSVSQVGSRLHGASKDTWAQLPRETVGAAERG